MAVVGSLPSDVKMAFVYALQYGRGIFKMYAVNIPFQRIFSKFTDAVSSKFSCFLASYCGLMQ